jgi:hypothetical protein
MHMAYCGTGGPNGSGDSDAFLSDGDDAESTPLPAHPQHALDQIADALGVTTALLSQNEDRAVMQADGTPSLLEASALLRAYLRIQDRETRQRCLDVVQAAARQP